MKKNLVLLLTAAVAMVGCRSYSFMETTPSVELAKKLPSMELNLDEQSFATVTGISRTQSTGTTLVDYSYSLGLGLGLTENSSVSYASSDLNNVKSLYYNNMYKNIISKIGEKKGKVVCRLISGNSKDKYGFTVLSACLLCVPNLFGMPFASNVSDMMVEMDFLDMNNNVVATYQSAKYKLEKYYALYWGYEDAEEVTIAETFKLCLDDINKQIKSDYDNLMEIYNK